MTKLNLHYAAWLLTAFSKKLGFFGLIALAISLVCCLFYVLKVLPLNKQLNLAQQQLEHVNPGERNIANLQQAPVNDTAQEMATFNQLLPRADSLHQSLRLLDEAALKQRLVLNRGDYKFNQIKQAQASSALNLSSYEVVLPVAGTYSQIRQFIASALQQQPALALSEVKIKRDNSMSANVEARLVFVLYLQGDSW